MNNVELIGYYGSDITHAQSAWTSTSRDLTPDKIERIPKLLNMLASEGHHTPFEKSSFHFLITVDQATHIHLIKHRIGVSVNGESARYKELKEDKYYLPPDWNGITLSKNIRHNNFEAFGEPEAIAEEWLNILKDYTELGNFLYHKCLEDLTPFLGRKRAKESARFFKTFNSQITMDVMFNWRSFYHFYQLRADCQKAQIEVCNIAKWMLKLIQELPDNPFEHTIKAFKL